MNATDTPTTEQQVLNGMKINDWIDAEIQRLAFTDGNIGAPIVTASHAAEIARGAALHIVFDKAALITNLANDIHARNVRAGWWNDINTGEDLHGKRNIGELLALVHSEISEALEADRKKLMDDKLPERPGFRVELIDALIRIFDILGSDYAGQRQHPAGAIFIEKLTYNAKRVDHTPEHRRAAADGKAY